MADNLSKVMRSKVMASIRGKNTHPEKIVRNILWSKGTRYRIHDRTVCGIPDISNKSKKFAVFIDGCFWHGCSKCYKEPTTNTDFWRNKIFRNKERRKIVKKQLQKQGWRIHEIWEHQINKNPTLVANRIADKIKQDVPKTSS